MWKFAHETGTPDRGTRCLGGFLALLVLFLTALAASPVAHGEFHHNSGHADHQCAITMFAQGAEPAQLAVEVSWPLGSACADASSTHEFAEIAEPAHLRPPASGPPVA